MHNFDIELKKLNKQQLQAVNQLDGPLLVLAGPGTGKTQLLSMRVANILQATDTPAENILCLTFTENGARNMRERLSNMIGKDAYKVNISTYHAFGGDLIRRYPEYFGQTRLQNPVDDLGRREIVAQIVEQMSYLNPLKQTRHHLGDLISTISEVKRALLDSSKLKQIAKENVEFLNNANKDMAKIFSTFTSMPRKLDEAIKYFEKTALLLSNNLPKQSVKHGFGTLAETALRDLTSSLETAREDNKTTPLTKWKNRWLAKNSDNQFILAGELQNKRLEALADVLDRYQNALEKLGLYDFDDMITRSIEALQTNKNFKYSLQEQYQYLLLDEFQDTNAAQFKLVTLLTDNPVNENRPNVMAVGDDDQAIYAFQGAHYSNMLDFFKQYRDVAVINLTHNYRSHSDILHTAHNISEQIESRLHHNFEGMSKLLKSSNNSLPPEAEVQRHEFTSDLSQNYWIASQIFAKIKAGTKPSQISVLAPQHKYLEAIVPFLNHLNVPVHYEKRENVLEAPVIRQLISMSKLVLALGTSDEATADSLWPEVLSYPFWDIRIENVWRLSWQVADSQGKQTWTKAMLENKLFKPHCLFFLNVAAKYKSDSCETMLDYLIGNEEVKSTDKSSGKLLSPLKKYYTNAEVRATEPELFYQTLSHLTVLRTKLRERQATADTTLLLEDLLEFVELYENAGERMVNTSPYNQHAESVQLMTVFKAKGLEFEHVFLPSCIDSVWGESSRANTNKLTLPANLAPIRHAGANEDERLRLFFVAITRAKVGLYLSSYAYTYNGKATLRLKYLNEQEQPDGSFVSQVLPKSTHVHHAIQSEAPTLETLEISWQNKHLDSISKIQLKSLLSERVESYQLSPTHLNSFTDMIFGGPEAFFFNTILRFPSAPSTAGQFGNAIHETLEWVQLYVTEHQAMPKVAQTIGYFKNRLKVKKIIKAESELLFERGEHALKIYLAQRQNLFKHTDKAEHNFRNEGVFIGGVHLSGKVDRMEIDKKTKTITVVDYKTGSSYNKWASDIKLHKYKQQLYCYKLLIEGSHSYKGYTVSEGRLEFIEPDSNGVAQSLSLKFNDSELEHTKKLLNALWEHVQKLDFPDTSKYPKSVVGTKNLEDDLINNRI